MMASEVERVRQSPVLMLITARSEFAPPWPDYAHVTRLSMTQLDRGDAVALVKHAARAHPLSAATMEKIVNRADGVPLFLEELTREELSHGGQIPDPLSARDVPATLQGFMLARIDGLDQSDKASAQAAAVIGRTFSHELLRMLEPCDPAELDAALDRLVAANLVFRHGTRPAATYLFKHALVQDAAYGTLPERKRRELHAGLAKILEARFAEVVATQPELLAHHHAGARNFARAVDYLITAAERALSRSAAVEAHAHCVNALELLSTLPQDQDRDRRELNVQIVLSRVWIATKGHTASEFLHALDRARALAEALDDQKTVALVIYGLWNVAWGKANYVEAGTHAQALLAWGQRCNDPDSTAFGHFVLGTGLMPAGELSDAARHFKEALQGARIELPGGHLMTWGGTIGRVAALASLHNCLFLSGQLRRAEKALHDAIAEAQNVSQLYARAIALNLICRAHALRRDAQSIQAPSAEMVQITGDQGYPQFGATALVFRGWALAMGGDPRAGLDLAIAGLDRCRALGFGCWLTHHLALLAECHWRAGDITAAQRTIVEAVDETERTGERVCEAELYRLDGELCRAVGGGVRRADYLFAKAIDIARERGARLLELRAATSLAHLHASNGRRAEALDALAPLYASFADARDIGEVYDAKVALEGLS
jgi:tetratricopeptide (TPR) repeat protein